MSDEADLHTELLAIRKGRAVQAVDLPQKLGPSLRRLADVGPEDAAATARAKVVARVEAGIHEFPPDLKVAVRAGLAIHPDARQRFLRQRLEWFAVYIGREMRTARRRMDEGFQRLAETLSASDGPDHRTGGVSGADWYVESLRSLVRLDGPAPVVWEERVVVAVSDGLAELEAALSLGAATTARSPEPPDEHRVGVEVLHGGRLTDREELSASVVRSMLVLPRPLAAGERHRFGLSITMPVGEPMAPHYVLTPFRRYDSFELSVRFPRLGEPVLAWRVEGAPPRTLDDPPRGGEPITPDRFGEVTLRFTELRVGHSYGVRWEPWQGPSTR